MKPDLPNIFRRHLITPVILITAVLISVYGCGIFKTRTPQSPLSNSSAVFQQPVNPNIVISNLKNAIKSLNTQNYLQCLSDSNFQFTPTNEAKVNNPGIWDNWSKTQEQIYFSNMKSAAQNLNDNQLQLSNERYEVQSSSSQQFSANYTLTVVHDRSSEGVPTVAKGQLVFILKSDANGLWHIQTWTDIADNNTFSWSDMKATFTKS